MLLDYDVNTEPESLQAGTPGDLTLVISNHGRQGVTVANVVITLPIGTNAKDLTPSFDFDTGATSGWNLTQDGGVLTLTPATGTGPVGKHAVLVMINNVAVNDEPGTFEILIEETAALGDGPATTGSKSFALTKVPAEFSLSGLSVTPAYVRSGDSVSVMWSGSQADQASYTLDYPEAPEHPIPVSNAGPYTATGLTVLPSVFTLNVTLTVPGKDQPVIVQKQATVSEKPIPYIKEFGQSKLVLSGADDRLVLSWDVQFARSLTLALDQLPGEVGVAGRESCVVTASGSPTIVVADAAGNQIGTLTPPDPFPQSLTFVLTASEGVLFVQRRVQVTVLPPQITGYYFDYSVWPPAGPQHDWYLHWTTVNASPVTITNWGPVDPAGTMVVNYRDTYKILAAGFGATPTAQVTIRTKEAAGSADDPT
jgi:hypothetical protein